MGLGRTSRMEQVFSLDQLHLSCRGCGFRNQVHQRQLSLALQILEQKQVFSEVNQYLLRQLRCSELLQFCHHCLGSRPRHELHQRWRNHRGPHLYRGLAYQHLKTQHPDLQLPVCQRARSRADHSHR